MVGPRYSPLSRGPEKPRGTSSARISRPQRASRSATPSGSPPRGGASAPASSSSASMVLKAASSSSPLARSRFSSSNGVKSPVPAAPPGAAGAPPSAAEARPRTACRAWRRWSAVACLRNIPAPMTFFSKSSFSWQRRSMCRSTAESVTRRTTRTSLVWPTRCTRAIACLSFCGFQSRSKSTTVSAAWRFSPRPPARAERRKMAKLGSEVKRLIRSVRSSWETWPSSRTLGWPRHWR
mmetsp:Transcript_102825/g.299942  ORF Transcript_102825/g.299942 Transcript_102825/m.299942 type:complete len:237 (+) Transcript_102825:106-816(+)